MEASLSSFATSLDRMKESFLLAAAQGGNLQDCDSLIELGADVNWRGQDGGDTPLLAACRRGHSDTVAFLLAHGADSNALGSDSMSALHIVAQRNDVATLNVLLESNVSLRATNKDGLTALDIAVRNSNDVIKTRLLQSSRQQQAPTGPPAANLGAGLAASRLPAVVTGGAGGGGGGGGTAQPPLLPQPAAPAATSSSSSRSAAPLPNPAAAAATRRPSDGTVSGTVAPAAAAPSSSADYVLSGAPLRPTHQQQQHHQGAQKITATLAALPAAQPSFAISTHDAVPSPAVGTSTTSSSSNASTNNNSSSSSSGGGGLAAAVPYDETSIALRKILDTEQRDRKTAEAKAARLKDENTLLMNELNKVRADMVARAKKERETTDRLEQLQGVPAALDKLDLPQCEELERTLKLALEALEARKALLIRDQIDQQKEQRLCVVCQEFEKSVVLLPCRHMCLCEGCSNNAQVQFCPLCRRPIAHRISVYA